MKKKVFIVSAIVLTIVSVGFLPKANIIKPASAKVIKINCTGDENRTCATGTYGDGGTWTLFGEKGVIEY